MKKLISNSFVYLVLGLIGGAFYREFTKFLRFDGHTALAYVHTHLLVLGMLMSLILALFAISTNLEVQKNFNRNIKLYNIFVALMVLTLFVRGMAQVMGMDISNVINASISGFAGISHIGITVAILLIFGMLKKIEIKSPTSTNI